MEIVGKSPRNFCISDDLFDDYEGIGTKEQLILILKKYKGILNRTMYDYLNSVIELEFSVIKKNISDADRTVLAELDIYKKAAIYNIYKRIVNIVNQKQKKLNISAYNTDMLYVNALDGSYFNLLEFNYPRKTNMADMPEGYKNINIGCISLFQTISNNEQKQAEILRIKEILNRLYNEKNPHPSNFGCIGGVHEIWNFEHTKIILKYEQKLAILSENKPLTDVQKSEIEITTQFHNELLEDYGLTAESFKMENGQSEGPENVNMQKVFAMPNLVIKDNIKYI